MGDIQRTELKLRLISALILAPIVLAALYLGSPYLELVLTVAAVLMAWEWDRLCGDRKFGLSGWAMALSIVVAGAAVAARRYDLVVVALLLGAAAAYVAAAMSQRAHPGWISVGPVIIGIPCAAVAWLRELPSGGFETAVWLIGAIWATDMAAYATGRLIGGVRLAPKISPHKTWAGLIGGMIGAGAWGVACGLWAGADGLWVLAVLGGCAAVVAQLGDLSVSFVKRRFGAKDASNLIPGHGGVLDRLDGMLTAAPAVVGLVLLTKGGIFSWS